MLFRGYKTSILLCAACSPAVVLMLVQHIQIYYYTMFYMRQCSNLFMAQLTSRMLLLLLLLLLLVLLLLLLTPLLRSAAAASMSALRTGVAFMLEC
jgi:hypothetical protein